MSMTTELAQRTDLLIANGQQTADLLRHLADNEIDSDYFAVTSECEAYGTETEAELSITEFALRAAGYVDALVEALEARDEQRANWFQMAEKLGHELDVAEKRIAELEASHSKLRETLAGIHNTIRTDGSYTPLAAILNAVKRAHEESAAAAGVAVEGE